MLRRLFEPLGYTVVAEAIPLDPQFPDVGRRAGYLDRDAVDHEPTLKSSCSSTCSCCCRCSTTTSTTGWARDEVDKLLRRGGEWLAGHPERELITRRYLRHDRRLYQGGAGRA